MEPENKIKDYGWKNSQPTDAHEYLFSVLDKVIADATVHKERCQIRIFDAGCGNGAIAGRLLAQGFQVTGCDASEMGIAQAKEAYPEGCFEVASVYDDLPKRFGNDWDIVIASEVIEHLYNPRAFVKNAHELLLPQGKCILTTPYHGYLKNLVMSLVGKMDSHFTVLWDGGHIKFWSKKTLYRLLEDGGFQPDSFHGAGRFQLMWKSMVVSCSKKVL